MRAPPSSGRGRRAVRGRTEFRVFILLKESGAPMTASQIAERLGISRKNALRVVRNLELKGYVKKTGDGGYVLVRRVCAF